MRLFLAQSGEYGSTNLITFQNNFGVARNAVSFSIPLAKFLMVFEENLRTSPISSQTVGVMDHLRDRRTDLYGGERLDTCHNDACKTALDRFIDGIPR